MSRAQAAIDILLIIDLFFFFQVALGMVGIPQLLEHYFPSIGVLWVNVCFGVLLLIAIGLILFLRRQSAADIGLVRTGPARVAAFTAIAIPSCYIAVLVAVPLYLWLVGQSVEGLIKERSEFFDEVPHLKFWQAALLSTFVGIHEEILFRGFILGRLKSLFRSNVAAVLVSSLIFGLLHFYQGPIGVVQTGTVGLVFAIVVTRARSLWPAILAHAAFDTIGLSLIPLLQGEFKELLQQVTTAPAN